jgi:uncharacterized Tic20 family protein
MEPSDQVPQTTAPGNDDKNIAMLAHLLGIFTGFVGALVIWLVKKDSSRFVDDQAKEALNFQITVAIALCGAWVLAILLIGFLLVPLIVAANFIFSILAAIAASKGQAYRYPFALRLVK